VISYESFDLFQLAGLALIWLKSETKADVELDLRDLISTTGEIWGWDSSVAVLN